MALKTLFCYILTLFVMFEKRVDLLELVNLPYLHIFLLYFERSKQEFLFEQGKYVWSENNKDDNIKIDRMEKSGKRRGESGCLLCKRLCVNVAQFA
jgi:hypothetical protein